MKEVVLILAVVLAFVGIIFAGGGFIAYVQHLMKDYDDLIDYDEDE